ncbi:MAG TPA: hypothetical protein VM711_10585, partial [Sphingomicrobium sp.]|nr:hypothetical protein [Sphingomicrobium sp.]
MRAITTRALLASATALSGLIYASPALADCISQAPVNPTNVTCALPGTLGFNGSTTSNLTVTVNNSGANTVVATSAGGPALISAGGTSSVVNFGGSYNPSTSTLVYGVDAGTITNPAISVGPGSIVTNDSGAAMRGTLTFGNATGSTVSTLANNYSNLGSVNHIGLIDGAITAAGNFNLNNMGVIGSAIGNASVTQTGAGAVNISNGVDGGYIAPFTVSGSAIQNGLLLGNITTAGDTTLVNHGGGSVPGAVISGNLMLGTGGTGTSTLTNGSVSSGNATIVGPVTMADMNNSVTNDGTITGNVTLNGTGSNTYNAGSLGSSGDNGLRLA